MGTAVNTVTNADQIDYWNAQVGETWASFQAQLDRQISPLGRAALDALAPAEGEAVLDIGCGCGETTIDLAARVGVAGRVVGVDISRPMLEVARHRPVPAGARRPEFLELDAQTGDLGEARFDAAFSRFGVMFFSDPVAAFANLRRALKPQGRLTFVCWRPLSDNPWMLVPLEAARPSLPESPPLDPLAPGPFALSDPGRVRSILLAAGFGSLTIEPLDAMIGGGDLEETLALTFKVGPLGKALRENPHLTPMVADAVRAAISPYGTPAGISMQAGVWIVRARNMS